MAAEATNTFFSLTYMNCTCVHRVTAYSMLHVHSTDEDLAHSWTRIDFLHLYIYIIYISQIEAPRSQNKNNISAVTS